MKLQEFIQKAPKNQQKELLSSLARAHGRTICTVYKWQQHNNHPPGIEAMAITEAWSGHQVSRFDERPDIFKPEELLSAFKNQGYTIARV